MSDNKKQSSKDNDEPSQPVIKLIPKFGNPASFRNQEKHGSQTFAKQPVKIVRHKG